ncbi:leucine-rich repeat-containing protein 61-like [Orbicella faveolata]|uniref:leucine-rich repeat-containing protein 61-like n=1 Tax=Orbicella faveolata TaxID=48498 RepID=UPI0009E4FF25|nr:leucine-rich repeat-containing protein 61-like [Orbicella faveolata]
MARAGGSVLTPHLLKSRTGEFDLESISFLDLSGMGLRDVSCISDCMGLLHLDLAKNNISDLKDLGRFRILHVQCMYSQTRVLKADTLGAYGVEDLSNLSSLNLSGNMIRSTNSLSCLTKLENLKVLRLHDSIQGFSNPVCVSEENYKKSVCDLLPKLKTLDGERVSGKGADLYEICYELDALLTDNDLQSEHGVALKTMPWNTEKLLSSNTLVQDRSVEEAEKGFRDVMLQCKKINEDADKAINNAKEALWN